MKICFLTTIISSKGYNTDIPGNFKPFNNYDFFLFTNLPKEHLQQTHGWNIIDISNTVIDSCINKDNENIEQLRINIYKSRYIKFMGWKYIKDVLNKNYDVIFYCDSCYVPNSKIDWNHYANIIINHESGIIQKIHDKMHGPISECSNIYRSKKDTSERMNKLVKYLKDNNCDNNKKICENTTFGYNPSNKKITDALFDFWKTYTETKISHRDQPLWGFISQKHNIIPHYVNNLHRINGSSKNSLFNCTGEHFNKNKRRFYKFET